MLTALFSQPLFLVISLSCHLSFQYTCLVRHVLTLAITTLLRAKPFWGVPKGYSRLLGVYFPQSATCGVGMSAARINANWNTYLFMLMTFGLVCNNLTMILYGNATVIHCYRRMCVILILLHIWFTARFIPSKLGVTRPNLGMVKGLKN